MGICTESRCLRAQDGLGTKRGTPADKRHCTESAPVRGNNRRTCVRAGRGRRVQQQQRMGQGSSKSGRSFEVSLLRFPDRSFGAFMGPPASTMRPRKPGSWLGTPTGFPCRLRLTPLCAFPASTEATGLLMMVLVTSSTLGMRKVCLSKREAHAYTSTLAAHSQPHLS